MQITGIIGAMDVEVAILHSMMKNARTETVSGIDFIIGSLEGRRVVLARSGVGKVFAALCAQTMILKVGTGAAVGEFVQEAAAGLRVDRNAFGEGVVRKEARGTLALWPAGRTGRAPVNRTRHVRRQNCVKRGAPVGASLFFLRTRAQAEDPEPTALLQFEKRPPGSLRSWAARAVDEKGAAVKPPLRAVPFSRRRTERRLVRQSGGLFARLDFLAEGPFQPRTARPGSPCSP